jgi:hypothetical protein
MPKGRTHTAEQIIRALREVDSGAPVGFVCRQLGIVEKSSRSCWPSSFFTTKR